MNTKTLLKCIEELKVEKPRIEYVLGMLETLVEMQEPELITTVYKDIVASTGSKATPVPLTDESSILDAKARVALSKMPPTQLE